MLQKDKLKSSNVTHNSLLKNIRTHLLTGSSVVILKSVKNVLRVSIVLVIFGLGLVIFAGVAQAQNPLVPQCRGTQQSVRQCVIDCSQKCTGSSEPNCETACLVDNKCDLQPCGTSDLFELLVNIYNLLLGLSALIAFALIVWNGLRLIIWWWFVGSDSEISAAKEGLKNAIAGFAIVLAAYLLVNTLIIVLSSNTKSITDLLSPLN